MVPVSKSTCSSAPPPISGSACHSSVATLETNTPGCTSIAASSLAVHRGPWSQESLRNQRLLLRARKDRRGDDSLDPAAQLDPRRWRSVCPAEILAGDV